MVLRNLRPLLNVQYVFKDSLALENNKSIYLGLTFRGTSSFATCVDTKTACELCLWNISYYSMGKIQRMDVPLSSALRKTVPIKPLSNHFYKRT